MAYPRHVVVDAAYGQKMSMFNINNSTSSSLFPISNDDASTFTRAELIRIRVDRLAASADEIRAFGTPSMISPGRVNAGSLR
jgi:hypothetical protein